MFFVRPSLLSLRNVFPEFIKTIAFPAHGAFRKRLHGDAGNFTLRKPEPSALQNGPRRLVFGYRQGMARWTERAGHRYVFKR